MTRRTFSDLDPGTIVEGRAITITEAHIVAWAGLTGDFAAFHVDEAAAARSVFATRVAHGPLVWNVALGHLSAELEQWSTLALLALHETRFTEPVRPGDTIRGRAEVQSKRPRENKDGGIVEVRIEVWNQHDKVVAEGGLRMLVGDPA